MNLLTEIRTYLAISWSKLRIFLNIPASTKPIPRGHYCYQVMSDLKHFPNGQFGFEIKKCPYFHYVGKHGTACTFTGFAGHDFAHADSCKICGEKEDYLEDDLSNTVENS